MRNTIVAAMLSISNSTPFSSGGNRLCFRHPEHPDRCLKVLRPDRTPAIRRSEKRFPANLRPLRTFDENHTEQHVLSYLHKHYPNKLRTHLPRTFGLVETDLGVAHDTTLVTDHDDLISETLEQHIWKHGLTNSVAESLQEFETNMREDFPNFRDLIPHNFAIQDLQSQHRLILIDGFGRLPYSRQIDKKLLSAKRLNKRMQNLHSRIERLLERKKKDTGPTHRLTNLKRT